MNSSFQTFQYPFTVFFALLLNKCSFILLKNANSSFLQEYIRSILVILDGFCRSALDPSSFYSTDIISTFSRTNLVWTRNLILQKERAIFLFSRLWRTWIIRNRSRDERIWTWSIQASFTEMRKWYKRRNWIMNRQHPSCLKVSITISSFEYISIFLPTQVYFKYFRR